MQLTLHKSIQLPDKFGLLLIIALAVAQASFRASIVPAWMNNDEPGHMEYILYIAEHRQLPGATTIDYELRQRLSDTFDQLDCSNDQPGAIRGCLRFHQFQEQPLYYVLQAGVHLVFKPATIESQLRLARLVSVALFGVLIISSWFTVRIAFPNKPVAAMIVSSIVATLPTLVNTMSSVNNDALAATTGALLVLATTALIVRGYSVTRAASLVAASVLAILSKPTAALLVPVVVYGTWLALSFRRRWLYLVPVAASVVAMVFVLDTQGSAAWLNWKDRTSDRVTVSDAHSGQYVFEFNSEEAIKQYLSNNAVEQLRGQEAHITAWTRAGSGLIHVRDGIETHRFDFDSHDEWTRFSKTLTISPEASYVEIRLQGVDTVPTQIDDVALFLTDSSNKNLLRNGSAERTWLLIRPPINAVIPFNINLRLQAIYSWWYTLPYYIESASAVFISFWGTFGWGGAMFRMPVTGILAVISVGGLIGLGIVGGRSHHEIIACNRRVRLLVFLLIYVLIALLFTFIRTDPPLPIGSGFVTSARYFLPAVIPTIILLVVGWYYLLSERIQQVSAALLIGLLFIAHGLSLFTVQFEYFLKYV